MNVNFFRVDELFEEWMSNQCDLPFIKYLEKVLKEAKIFIRCNTLVNMGVEDPSKNRFIVENTYRSIEDYDIWNILRDSLEKCFDLIKVEKVNLILAPISPQKEFVIKEMYGSVAYTLEDSVFLLTNSVPNKQKWVSHIKSLCFHEYCHIYRNQKSVRSRKRNLLDTVIEEGFAESFVKYSLGEEYLGPWTTKQTKKTVLSHLNKFKEYASEQNPKVIYAFMNGDIYNDLPHWIGYVLGYQLIQFLIDTLNMRLLDLIHNDSHHVIDVIDWLGFESYLGKGD